MINALLLFPGYSRHYYCCYRRTNIRGIRFFNHLSVNWFKAIHLPLSCCSYNFSSSIEKHSRCSFIHAQMTKAMSFTFQLKIIAEIISNDNKTKLTMKTVCGTFGRVKRGIANEMPKILLFLKGLPLQ